MSLQKWWVIGNTVGWALGFPMGLIGMARLEDVSKPRYINPSEESLFLAVAFTGIVVTCQWVALHSQSNVSFKWILGSLVGALIGHVIIDGYSFSTGDYAYLAHPIFNDLIGCTGLDIPPRWFSGLTGCYGVFPPISTTILGLLTATGQLLAVKFSYRWAIINALAFFAISIVITVFSILRLFDFNLDIFLIGSILGLLYACLTMQRLAREVWMP